MTIHQRCAWVSDDPLYQAYHDEEWGRPVHNGQALFGLLCLEGQQAGLSWITVLRKRAHYLACFHDFVPERVATMTEADVERLVLDAGIIRHRGKIQAIIGNARAYLTMQAAGEDFAAFVWGFAGPQDAPVRTSMAEVPARTEASDALAKALKQRGFKFVGSTICYAFMQAAGLVNDHHQPCDLAQRSD
ncbi:MAG: DNA-3-methyladenine glycosylase I [Neisseriaceae bacterium]|nr:DNA-3-methyladenine glycosylase I [Neisseriaceae bacterium]